MSDVRFESDDETTKRVLSVDAEAPQVVVRLDVVRVRVPSGNTDTRGRAYDVPVVQRLTELIK
jgi:hypothetical protein